jgi:hypothetical protein
MAGRNSAVYAYPKRLSGIVRGLRLVECRKLFCGVMAVIAIIIPIIVILPAPLLGQDAERAMLHSDGGTSVNGKAAPNSSAIFLHDRIETRPESNAKIDAQGSTVTIRPGTVVVFDGDELILDHGGLQLNSARATKVRANCMTITPLSQDWTRYDVSDANGKLTVSAYDNDVKIHIAGAVVRQSKHAASQDVTVHRGEQITRDERCRTGSEAASVDTSGPILNSPWAIGTGAVAIGILTCWALCREPGPVSPDKP